MAAVGLAPHIRAPRPYSLGDDFVLWTRRFEAYTRAVKAPQEQLCDSLLALLDDAAFRAFDLLGLGEDVTTDYKLLTQALSKRFAPSTGQRELRWQLSQRSQEADESLDAFADALIHLANRAYPNMEPQQRMELVCDRFIAGVASEEVQDAFMRCPPEKLDEARTVAKRVEAAKAARKAMRVRTTTGVHAMSSGTALTDDTCCRDEVAAIATTQDALVEAVRQNTEMLQRLMTRLSSSSAAESPRRRRPQGPCWQCGQHGHLRRDCTSKPPRNNQRSTTWVNRQPQMH